MYWPGQLPGKPSYISGELQAGEEEFMYDWSALVTPQKATLYSTCVHFVIRILSTSLASVSIFSVVCCSRYLSLWRLPLWHRESKRGAGKVTFIRVFQTIGWFMALYEIIVYTE